MAQSCFRRDLWNVYGLASHETFRAERATLTAERKVRRFASGPAHYTVHCHSAARAIATVSRYIWQTREAGAGRQPEPGEAIGLHTATGVPVLVPPPRMPGER